MKRVSFLLLIAVVVGLLISLPAFGQGVRQRFKEARDLIVDINGLNAEATDLLVQVDEELDELIDYIDDAIGADDETRDAALVAIKTAISIKEEDIRDIKLQDISKIFEGDLSDFVDELQSAIEGLWTDGEITNRYYSQMSRKLANIDAIVTWVENELDEFEGLLGEGEGCYDAVNDEFFIDGTVDDCLAEADGYLRDGDYEYADLVLGRAITLIEDVLVPTKDLMFRKLGYIKRDLRSVDRALARFERRHLRRTPRAELPVIEAASVTAQSINPITEARDEVAGMRILIIDINNLLLDINDEFDYIWDLLDEAIYELDVEQDPIYAASAIELAIEKKQLTLEEEFFELVETISVLSEQKADLEAKITELCALGKIKTPKTCERILIKLGVINQKLEYMSGVITYIMTLLDDGQVANLPCVGDPNGEFVPCVDVDDWLYDALEHIDSENYDDAIASIGEAERLLTLAIEKKDGILLGKRGEFSFIGIVKKIESDLRFIDRLLRREERRAGAGGRFRGRSELPIFTPLISASPTAFRAEGASSIRVQVFGLNGQLLFDQEALGSTLAFTGLGNDGRVLANGVYLYVITARGPDGQLYQSPVQKLVLLR